MKRSASLSLVLMGSLSLGLAGCGDEPVKEEFQTFNSVGDCVRSGEFTLQQCQTMADDAKKQAPKFASKEECEKAFGIGACETGQVAAAPADKAPQNGTTSLTDSSYRSSGSSWMPLMAGYMMGRFMSGGTAMQGAQPLFRGPEQQPQQGTTGTTTTSYARTYRTAGGETVRTDSTGRVSNPSPAVRQSFAQSAKPFNARTMTTSKGGFGGSSKFGGSAGS